jgi:hypothetical protein
MEIARLLMAAGTLAVLAVSACSGGGAETDVKNTTVSKGQALMDLKKAQDSGVLTPSEYDRERKRILNE